MSGKRSWFRKAVRVCHLLQLGWVSLMVFCQSDPMKHKEYLVAQVCVKCRMPMGTEAVTSLVTLHSYQGIPFLFGWKYIFLFWHNQIKKGFLMPSRKWIYTFSKGPMLIVRGEIRIANYELEIMANREGNDKVISCMTTRGANHSTTARMTPTRNLLGLHIPWWKPTGEALCINIVQRKRARHNWTRMDSHGIVNFQPHNRNK